MLYLLKINPKKKNESHILLDAVWDNTPKVIGFGNNRSVSHSHLG